MVIAINCPMKTRSLLKSAVLSLDENLAWTSALTSHEHNAVLCYLIHGLFANREEAQCGLLDPQQGFTMTMLREFLAHFTGQGYRFLSPPDLTGNLSPGAKYVLLTFDDGYYNNIRALPLLEEFRVPAVFFVSSDHVKFGKAFWWDALYRETRKRARPEEELRRMIAAYKLQKPAQIERDILSRFGKSALRPAGDLDRPFTAPELKHFAEHPLVFLGNHTRDHAILTNGSSAGIREQITGCQSALREMTGKIPQTIAYPNGNCSAEIVAVAREAGLQFGFLNVPGRNPLPLGAGSEYGLTLKRFLLWGDCSVEAQCRASRSPISLYRLLTSLKKESGPFLPASKSLGKAKSFARSAGS